MQIFDEKQLSDVLKERHERYKRKIESLSDNYILNVNETEYINCLVKEFYIDLIDIQSNQTTVSQFEKLIPAEYFPGGFNTHRGEKYQKNVIKFHIPVSGDPELLWCSPSSGLIWSTEICLDDGCICFEIINFHDNPESIKRDGDHIINNMLTQATYINADVDRFNNHLYESIKGVFQSRKERILKNNNILASLGLPLKKKANIPSTFAVSSPVKHTIKVNMPQVHEIGYQPEPTLNDSVYKDILSTIHDVGRQFEKMPSTYLGKREEALRDHILITLEAIFEGSATGETFNKSGKTDILLRYEGNNVFIAECKFWKGKKGYLDTITQLLGYLTWRDSKAAIILFVRNLELSSILKEIESVTPLHANFLGFVRREDSTILNYRFHTNGDTNREIKLAVLLFHLPNLSK
jgi:hypothetical protein